MRMQRIAPLITLLLLLAVLLTSSALGQESQRGTTLVCVPGEGRSVTLAEYSDEQLAAYATRFGHEPVHAHPATLGCQDPAGIAIGSDVEWTVDGWTPAVSLICTQDNEGGWFAPDWMYETSHNAVRTTLDPATGTCPLPPSRFYQPSSANPAAMTAVYLTELEVAGDYERLYAWMYPDSKTIVPQAAMEGWYRTVFAAQPPVWMTVDDVRLVEWTWDVTGTIYPSAAEVTYRQRFADGHEIEGVTHLVRDHGVWRWFFGRDRAFVEEQIARFGSQPPNPTADVSPPLATLPPAASTAQGTLYTILDLGTGDGNWSSADHINERGQVLWSWGTTQDPLSDRVGNQHPMLWQDGRVTDLSNLGIDHAIAINDVGLVLAGVSGHTVMYESDTGTVTPLSAFDDGFAVDINNAGAVVGWVNQEAVIASNVTVETIPVPQGYKLLQPAAINKAGQVAGRIANVLESTAHQRAFLYADDLVTILPAAPGADASSAGDLNDGGQVAGNTGRAGALQRPQAGQAFVYDGGTGTTTDIGSLLGYQNSSALAINSLGQVVGYAVLPTNGADPMYRAYLYDLRTGVITDLNQLIPQDSGWYLVDALDINDARQIVGEGLIGGEMHAFVLTPNR